MLAQANPASLNSLNARGGPSGAIRPFPMKHGNWKSKLSWTSQRRPSLVAVRARDLWLEALGEICLPKPLPARRQTFRVSREFFRGPASPQRRGPVSDSRRSPGWFESAQFRRSEFSAPRQCVGRAVGGACGKETHDGGAEIEGEVHRTAGPVERFVLLLKRRAHISTNTRSVMP